MTNIKKKIDFKKNIIYYHLIVLEIMVFLVEYADNHGGMCPDFFVSEEDLGWTGNGLYCDSVRIEPGKLLMVFEVPDCGNYLGRIDPIIPLLDAAGDVLDELTSDCWMNVGTVEEINDIINRMAIAVHADPAMIRGFCQIRSYDELINSGEQDFYASDLCFSDIWTPALRNHLSQLRHIERIRNSV